MAPHQPMANGHDEFPCRRGSGCRLLIWRRLFNSTVVPWHVVGWFTTAQIILWYQRLVFLWSWPASKPCVVR